MPRSSSGNDPGQAVVAVGLSPVLLSARREFEPMMGVLACDAAGVPLRLGRLGAQAHEALDHFGDRRERRFGAPSVHENLPWGLEGKPLVGDQIEGNLDSHEAE